MSDNTEHLFKDCSTLRHSKLKILGTPDVEMCIRDRVIIDPFKLNLVCKSFNRNFSLIEDSLVSSLAVLPAASLAEML